ncbi:hypothetical protein [Candidatus Methylacidithermus pantelleriae]|uniref:Uncharacterized protein n=1 Tax=Candidatus Methylacidithermus pantelleriae TaxID=2744239 RepID=A0A8J2BJM7_9BACT|nr:hypothetical protein [Candidatus Methylacidithermus pantelleriae]CAF0700561.1 hypothetical protein MPNT_380013 [Candidatus Methylacidithermus pantelleriae]
MTTTGQEDWELFAYRKLSMITEECDFESNRDEGVVFLKVEYVEGKPASGEAIIVVPLGLCKRKFQVRSSDTMRYLVDLKDKALEEKYRKEGRSDG